MSKVKLNLKSNIVAYSDIQNTSNPLQRVVDWQYSASGVEFTDFKSTKHVIPKGDDLKIYGVNNDTATVWPTTGQASYSIEKHPRRLGEYLVRYISGSQGAYDDLNLMNDWGSYAFVLTPQGDGTVKLDGGDGTVEPGTLIWLPGALWGEAGLWSDDNSGIWEVVCAQNNGASHILKRVFETDPTGVAQTVTTNYYVKNTEETDHIPRHASFTMGTAGGFFEVTEFSVGFYCIKYSGNLNQIQTSLASHFLISDNVGYVRIESDQPLRLALTLVEDLNSQGGSGAYPYRDYARDVYLIPIEPGVVPGVFEITGLMSEGIRAYNLGNIPANVMVMTGMLREYLDE